MAAHRIEVKKPRAGNMRIQEQRVGVLRLVGQVIGGIQHAHAGQAPRAGQPGCRYEREHYPRAAATRARTRSAAAEPFTASRQAISATR